jgi:hypothetical protein
MADDNEEFPTKAENVCLDLVAITDKCTKFIPVLLSLVQGRWHDLGEVVHQAGLLTDDTLIDGVVVAWLDDPVSSPSWVSVVFHHHETMWTSVAHFNREALLAG